MPSYRFLRRHIQRLGPYASLGLLVVPLAVAEPLKLVAVLVAGKGHVVSGTIAMLCAYSISLLVVERLFQIVKPKLLTLPWFAAMWKRFVVVRHKVLSLCFSTQSDPSR